MRSSCLFEKFLLIGVVFQANGRFFVGAMNDPALCGEGGFTDEGI